MQYLRKLILLQLLLTAIAVVPGCGKKGPLYLPPPARPTPPAQTPAATPNPTPAPTPPQTQ